MSWIKPSFLWMMYRSGWATKENQENILSIHLKKDGFNDILFNSVLTIFDEKLYTDYESWKNKLIHSDVRCQWDPARDCTGNPLQDRTIQLGMKGESLRKYVDIWIEKIDDITESVIFMRNELSIGTFNINNLPKEIEYPVSENI
jgi:hypothetical protein